MIINGKDIIHKNEVIMLNPTCQSATCFFIANLFDHIAHKTIVIVEPKYVANIIAKDCSGCNIHEYAKVSDMI